MLRPMKRLVVGGQSLIQCAEQCVQTAKKISRPDLRAIGRTENLTHLSKKPNPHNTYSPTPHHKESSKNFHSTPNFPEIQSQSTTHRPVRPHNIVVNTGSHIW